jgi:hypothetical protein
MIGKLILFLYWIFVEPDLIIAEEVVGQTGFSHFKSDVLDIYEPGEWTSAPFSNQSAQQDIALYYKHEHFSFISTSTINTASSSGVKRRSRICYGS